MSRGQSFVVSGLIVALLVVSVVAEIWIAPAAVQAVVAMFPETAPLRVQSMVWFVLAVGCWQVVGVAGIGLALIAAKPGRDGSVRVLERAIIGSALLFVLLASLGLIAAGSLGYSTPGLTLALIGSGIVGLVAAGAVGLHVSTRT